MTVQERKSCSGGPLEAHMGQLCMLIVVHLMTLSVGVTQTICIYESKSVTRSQMEVKQL
jgi:hypothetical protein